jgi:hypothetical protein
MFEARGVGFEPLLFKRGFYCELIYGGFYTVHRHRDLTSIDKGIHTLVNKTSLQLNLMSFRDLL